MRHAVFLVPTLFTILFMSDVHLAMAGDRGRRRATGEKSRQEPVVSVYVDAPLNTDAHRLHWRPAHKPALSSKLFETPASTSQGEAEDPLLEVWGLEEDEAGATELERLAPDAMARDWRGLGRDTAFFLGYEAVAAGILYVLPEDVTKWSPEQRRTSLQKWWDNVRHPQWDSDNWYVNYLGHPYFGAIGYIRARERQFGAFGGFWYAALLSGLYEFGIEALFERPSYQDLIMTPVGGLLIGALLFEPIREYIRGKPELRWYDHIPLALTDPLGVSNSLFERLLGIPTDIRVQLHLPSSGRSLHFSEPTARSLNRPLEQHRQLPGIGIEFVFGGKRQP